MGNPGRWGTGRIRGEVPAVDDQVDEQLVMTGVDTAEGVLQGDGGEPEVAGLLNVVGGFETKAKASQFPEHSVSGAALVGELITEVTLSDQTVALKGLEARSEEVGGEARKTLEMIVEANGASVEVTDDEECPAVTDEIEGACDGAKEPVGAWHEETREDMLDTHGLQFKL